MKSAQEQRHAYFDRDLEIEAYNLSGIVQKFPNHFHEFFVIGFIESGKRHLWCKGQEYDLNPGDVVFFNPRDNHCCAPVNGELLDYRAINITVGVMENAVKEITGKHSTLHFTRNVEYHSELTRPLGELHHAILTQAPKLEKEEAFYLLLEQVLQEHAVLALDQVADKPDEQIQNLCVYMESHYSENITLDDLLSMTSFGKSYLLRSFTRQVGVSPYRYLQTVRLEKAKKFLEQGMTPVDTAVLTGFSDQSHFSNSFKSFIGLTPKQYQRIFTENPSFSPKVPKKGGTDA